MAATQKRLYWRKLAIAGVSAAVAVAVVNVIYYLIATAVTGVEVVAPQPPDGELGAVPLGAVIFASILFLLIASVVYGAVLFAVPGTRADTVYIVIAVLALLVSFRFPGNYFDPTFPPESRWVLGITHVIGAAVGVAALLWMYRRT